MSEITMTPMSETPGHVYQYRLRYDVIGAQDEQRWIATGKPFNDPECDWNAWRSWHTIEVLETDKDQMALSNLFMRYAAMYGLSVNRLQPIRNVSLQRRTYVSDTEHGPWEDNTEDFNVTVVD